MMTSSTSLIILNAEQGQGPQQRNWIVPHKPFITDRPIMSWRRIAKAPNFRQRVNSDRLVLRPYRYGDADDLFSYANDEEWSRYITPPYPYRRDYAEKFIE